MCAKPSRQCPFVGGALGAATARGELVAAAAAVSGVVWGLRCKGHPCLGVCMHGWEREVRPAVLGSSHAVLLNPLGQLQMNWPESSHFGKV